MCLFLKILFCRYGHFSLGTCELFQNQPQEAGLKDVTTPDDPQLLKDLLFSYCPRCGQVGVAMFRAYGEARDSGRRMYCKGRTVEGEEEDGGVEGEEEDGGVKGEEEDGGVEGTISFKGWEEDVFC